MRAVIQRVKNAKVEVKGNITGRIDHGILLLAGFEPSDNADDFNYIIDKTINLRIFEDENGKMNLSVKDTGGKILVVPNFTLYGDARKGRRPGFSQSSSPLQASEQFSDFCELFRTREADIQTGIFRENMQVSLINDGPVTILLDSGRLF